MKVVLFCGGLGIRMREGSTDRMPKPMAMVGDRPLLWNVMRYYAHFGHTEFILCLGYGANFIKDYFLNYRETASNDFVLTEGGGVRMLSTDISDWRITFVDTGIDANLGMRLRAVRPHLGSDEVFLANYADTLTNAPLDDMVERFTESGAVGSLLAVPMPSSMHWVEVGDDGGVTRIGPLTDDGYRINGGYFVLRREIFEVLEEGEELVEEPFQRLIERGQLAAYAYDGFWVPADTMKERLWLEQLYNSGFRPWAVWDPLRSVDRRNGVVAERRR